MLKKLMILNMFLEQLLKVRKMKMLKKVMDDVSYAYREGRNILTMRKKL